MKSYRKSVSRRGVIDCSGNLFLFSSACRRKALRPILVLICVLTSIASPASAYQQEINALSTRLAESLAKSGKKTIAVVDFTDLQGNVTELGRFLAEEFSVALTERANGFAVIDRTHLRVILEEHKLSTTGIIDPKTARKLGEIAGAEALLTGSITPFGDSVRLSVKVLDTATARMIGAATADIPKTQAIADLLSKGVQDQTRDLVPQSETSAKGMPLGSAKDEAFVAYFGDHVLTVQGCRRTGANAICSGYVVNKGDQTQRFGLRTYYFTDNLGNQSQRHYPGIRGIVATVPGVPVKLDFTLSEVARNATSITLVFEMGGAGPDVILRDIILE
jgi:TolB-like protein